MKHHTEMYLFLNAALVTLLLAALPAQAQSSLELYTPVFGEITEGQSEDWTFAAAEGEVLSFVVEASSQDFDPVLNILDSSGNILISNDDYHYPDSSDALLEAVTIPQFGAYTARVSGFEGSSGEYTLTMLDGFSEILYGERFDNANSWQATTGPLIVTTENGQLSLSLPDRDQSGIALDSEGDAVENYYAQATILNIDAPNGWTVGMTIRQQSPDIYYLLTLNHQGQWSFVANTAQGQRILRELVISPAIPANETAFRLGVLANGPTFDIFYNGQFIGQVIDSAISSAGRVGLMVGSASAFGSRARVLFDDVNITVPRDVDGETILPQRLTALTSQDTVRELQRRQVIPPQGEMALTIPESFASYNNPGVQPYLLSSGASFNNFVVGTTVSLETSSEGPAGCGLLLRLVDNTQYTLAYVDQTGAYGLSNRSGEAFEPGLFGEIPTPANAGTHQLIVIAKVDTLYYYINGQFLGTQTSETIAGEIGNAVVNFEAISTSCRFANTWLWRWN